MSLLMVRKSFPAHAADKNENIAQDSAIVAMWQVLGDAEAYLREGKKNHNVKNVLAAAIKAAEKENPNDRSVLEAKKVLAQFDAAEFKVGDLVRMNEGGLPGKITKIEPNGHFRVSFLYNRANGFSQSFSANEIVMVKPAKDSVAADADKSEELEREIKGDVVAVVSGNAARVSKDVSFATAKEGVESFARKNGVSVIASQEYGEAYKFKFSAAVNDAQDANGDEVIAQKNGCKLVHNTLNDGYWFYTKSGAGWGLTATNKVAAVNEFNRLVDSAKDSSDSSAQDR